MPSTLTSAGIVFDDATLTSLGADSLGAKAPFIITQSNTASYSVNNGAVQNTWQTNDFSIPAKSKLTVSYNIPCRHDYEGWGGLHTHLNYRINNGAWVYMGESGYSAVMHTPSRGIAHYRNMHHFDFTTLTSNFTLGFLFQHRSYAGTTYINNTSENNLNDGDSTYTGVAHNYRMQIFLKGFTYA